MEGTEEGEEEEVNAGGGEMRPGPMLTIADTPGMQCSTPGCGCVCLFHASLLV